MKRNFLLVIWLIACIWSHAQPRLVTTTAPIMPVYSLTFSPGGRLFLTLSGERALIIWDSDSKMPIHAFYSELDIETAVFRPDEKSIATMSYDDTVRLWDIEKRKLIWKVPLKMTYSAAMEFNPEGTQLAVMAADGSARILDANSGRTLHRLSAITPGEAGVSSVFVKFSGNGKYLVTSAGGYPAKVWDAKKAKLLFTLSNEEVAHTGIIISADSRYVITRSANSTVWELASGKRIATLNSESADFIKGTNKIISSAYNGTFLWEIGKKTPDTLRSFPAGQALQIMTSPDGKYIAVGDEEGIANVVSSKNPDVLLFPDDLHHFKAFSFHPARSLLYGFCDDQLSFADLTPLRESEPLKFYAVPQVQFRVDGQAINISFEDQYGDENHHEVIWNLATGAIMQDDEDTMVFSGGFYFSGGNKRISVNDEGTDIHVMNNEGKPMVLKNSGPAFIFNRDSTCLISKWPASFREGSITYLFEPAFVWRLQDGALVRKGVFASAEFSPDGRRFVTTDSDGKITVHETLTGKEIISVTFLSPADWVVTHPSGLFDASTDALGKLYFSEGTRIVTDDSLPEKYYEPGLWTKAMKGEKLRTP